MGSAAVKASCDRTCSVPPTPERRHLRQSLVHHEIRRPLPEARLARLQIEGAQLLAEHDARAFLPAPASGTANPRLRAKLPPVAIGAASGVLSRLNSRLVRRRHSADWVGSSPAQGGEEQSLRVWEAPSSP